ncbi:hypothetical protein [Anaerosphaera multitolerans]|uniref:hypothetical protein n=1 Tax=Anaerosphaera multitolerans TaxID=2487351 RepID=UPI0013E2AFEF|nr:hypothetical protein [Anaerosphaera multitolerans]
MKFQYLIDIESRKLSKTLNEIEKDIKIVQIANRTIVENLTYFDILVGYEENKE